MYSSLRLSNFFFCFFFFFHFTKRKKNFLKMIIMHFVFIIKVSILYSQWCLIMLRDETKTWLVINPNSSWPNLLPFEITKNHISLSFFIRRWCNNMWYTIWVENLSSGINKKCSKQEFLNISNCFFIELLFNILYYSKVWWTCSLWWKVLFYRYFNCKTCQGSSSLQIR